MRWVLDRHPPENTIPRHVAPPASCVAKTLHDSKQEKKATPVATMASRVSTRASAAARAGLCPVTISN